MKINKYFWGIILLVVGILLFLGNYYSKNFQPCVVIDDTKVFVEIADSPKERKNGLMNRKKLKSDRGMFFIFPKADIQSFWMKNTSIPLDIIFIDKKFKIINIEQASPGVGVPLDKLERYKSKRPAKYVLEVNQGWAEQNGLHTGSKIDFERNCKLK